MSLFFGSSFWQLRHPNWIVKEMFVHIQTQGVCIAGSKRFRIARYRKWNGEGRACKSNYLSHIFFSPTKSVTGHSQHEQVLAFFCQGNSAHTRGSSMKSSHNHLNMLTLKNRWSTNGKGMKYTSCFSQRQTVWYTKSQIIFSECMYDNDILFHSVIARPSPLNLKYQFQKIICLQTAQK